MFKKEKNFKYPGTKAAMDGNTAVIMCERESSDAAGAYPITPSTQMGEYWAEEAAKGHINISGRPLIFIEPEGEHAAAAVTAGLSMTGLRSANFSSGQGIAYMHESLYAAVGKRLTYVLNIGARAMTKATLNVHAGHDDYHCVDDTGFFQLFAKNAQEVCDLNIIAHKIAETALNPGIVAQDGFLTTHLIESLRIPERELIEEYLGRPDDIIDTPTPAQRILYGEKRRRIPVLWDVDNPVMAGIVQNQDSYMQSVAAQRPFFFDHINEITDRCMREFYELTGRKYRRVLTYKCDDADYLIVGQGSMIPSAEAVADYLRQTRKVKVGVVNMIMFRPFPGDLIVRLIKGRKGAAVLERLDQPLAEDLPLIREIRAAANKSFENGRGKDLLYPGYERYTSLSDLPPLYSGSYGMGSRDLQPEGIVAAVENMLPDGKKRRFFYLSIDFIRDNPISPKQEIYQQILEEAYPGIKDLAIRGSENPNLMPKESVTVRFHSVGGWGAITTGKNLAMTLYDLLGYEIKANPKYGSEKKGQPTTYYLSAAPEPIRINCEYYYVDVVLSPDPYVFKHTNALAGLKKGGVFIIQSDLGTPQKVWESIPVNFQKIIVDNEIKVFYVDAFKIAREEASDPELQFRMQGIAFQGSFFAASPIMERTSLTEEKLFKAIEAQLQHKFGSKGARVVEDNLRVVRRGFSELREIKDKVIGSHTNGRDKAAEPPLPVMLKAQPQSKAPLTDIHRFWEQTGNFYISGKGSDNLTDPFIGLSLIPAATGVFRDMTGIRFEHPEWIAENCTGCGNCWTACPDTAIPGLVHDISDINATIVSRLRKKGHAVKHLNKAVRVIEKKVRELLAAASENDNASSIIEKAVPFAIGGSKLSGEERSELESELELYKNELNGFKFAITKPFYSVPEKKAKNSGGLLTINVNPYTCKGCMECVEVCGDDALRPVSQTPGSVEQLRRNWEFWMDLPSTPEKFIRITDIEQGVGALETLLLDKECYLSTSSGDGACLGCTEKTVVHLFTGAVEALMQPRIKKHVEYLTDLISRLESFVKMKLVEAVPVSETEKIEGVLNKYKDSDLTLGALSNELDAFDGGKPIDSEWLERITNLISKLKDLRWRYTEGTTGKGRTRMGMLNSTGCTSVWGSTYPFNPYPFPWANHLFQDSPSLAMGVFEGHMAKMAEGFKVIRQAELELEEKYKPQDHDEFFRYFNWRDFSDEEFLLCPPVVALGGDGAMYDIGFQNLSRALMSGKPVKILVMDTQVYSNTGGQACTSGFTGQISDMAQYGKAIKGKEEVRKEIALIGMAHRTSYVMQGTISSPAHLLEGFIEGLMAKRPALFNVYCACQPEHGIADDAGTRQAKLAVESRAYPLFKYHPDQGELPSECFNLDGNPDMDGDWPVYTLEYREDGNGGIKTLEVPMTFADFAVTEARFRKHFRTAPPDTWNDDMVLLADFLKLDPDEQKDKYPYIWAVDKKQRLQRVLVAKPLVEACEDRLHFWHMLKALAAEKTEAVDVDALSEQIKLDMVERISEGLVALASENEESLSG